MALHDGQTEPQLQCKQTVTNRFGSDTRSLRNLGILGSLKVWGLSSSSEVQGDALGLEGSKGLGLLHVVRG